MGEASLFDFMREQGWTTLEIMHDRQSGKMSLRGATEWLENTVWDRYGEVDLVSTMEWFETEGVRPRIARSPVKEHYGKVVELMRRGGHEVLELLLDRKQDIRFLAGIHSTRLGNPAGGIRRHSLEDPEIDVFSDIFNLSRDMSFKNAAAGIPNGGCKLGVHSSLPEGERDKRFYGFLAYCIDRQMAFTGPDMGFNLEDANRIREFTKNIVGGTARTGSGGATGITAAWGVFLAMKAALMEEGFEGLRVAVQGAGELGGPLVKHLVDAGARVLVADISDEALAGLPGTVERGAAEGILRAECDILAPCAVGGVLTEETIAGLRCRMVVGGANNQLAATSQKQEYRMARLVADRGILFLPDWIVNAGGVIQGKMEHVRGEKFVLEDAKAEAGRVIPPNVEDVLYIAQKQSITPVEAAYRKFEADVYGTAG